MNLPPCRRILAAIPMAMAVLATGAPAEATVVRALTLAQKVDVAPVVIHGVVERVDTAWRLYGAQVETRVTIRVVETIKGDFAKNERILLLRGGGTIDDFTQTAPGLSEYEPGEEVVMFLEPLGAAFVAIGIGIGKYEVRVEAGERTVHHAPAVGLAQQDAEGRTEVYEARPMEPAALGAFLKELRSLARGQRTIPAIAPKGATLKAPLPLPGR